MRDTVLDTETTGLDPAIDRIVEIGAIRWDGAKFHRVINPQMPIPKDATRIHGIKDDDVVGKSTFADIAVDLIEFLGSCRLVAHNASFDVSFLDAEFGRAGFQTLPNQIVDTLELANKKFPGGRNSLDTLCRKFDISLKRRKLHGALLDCELLKEVYDRLLHGDVQGGLDFTSVCKETISAKPDYTNRPLRKSLLSEECYKLWTAFVATIPKSAWHGHSRKRAA